MTNLEYPLMLSHCGITWIPQILTLFIISYLEYTSYSNLKLMTLMAVHYDNLNEYILSKFVKWESKIGIEFFYRPLNMSSWNTDILMIIVFNNSSNSSRGLEEWSQTERIPKDNSLLSLVTLNVDNFNRFAYKY